MQVPAALAEWQKACFALAETVEIILYIAILFIPGLRKLRLGWEKGGWPWRLPAECSYRNGQ